MNEKTRELVGIQEIDFSPDAILDAMTSDRTPLASGGFHVVITGRDDSNGHNALVGPNYQFGLGKDPVSITELVLPDDECDTDKGDDPSSVQCERRRQFGDLVDMMQAGETSVNDTVSFTRSIGDHDSELVHFAFAAVQVKSSRTVDPSDLSAGLDIHNTTVYSVGLAETDQGLSEAYKPFRNKMIAKLWLAVGILATVLVLAIASVIYVASVVSSSIAAPFAKLQRIVRDINRSVAMKGNERETLLGRSDPIGGLTRSFVLCGRRVGCWMRGSFLCCHLCCQFFVSPLVLSDLSFSSPNPCALFSFPSHSSRENIDLDGDELPEIRGGSLETTMVRDTFSKLFTCVRSGTTAFYAGELERAYETFENSLSLFTKLDNEKAIAIANNDLGIIMLTLYRTMKATGNTSLLYGFKKDELIEKGSAYFRKAIDIGEEAIERINQEEGFTVNYLIFMQQLSNRYFNRALFLLTVKDDHPDPEEAERQGLTDLATCKDMDREVVDNGDQEGFKGEMDVYFELLMGRIRGMLNLIQMGVEDEWGLDELLEDARKALVKALRIPSHPLFRHMEPAGQMQRLDFALIEYYSLDETKDLDMAAKIAIRMLMEDDYVIGENAVVALKTIIDTLSDGRATGDLHGMDPSDVRSQLFHCRHLLFETMALQFSKRDGLRKHCHVAANAGDATMETF